MLQPDNSVQQCSHGYQLTFMAAIFMRLISDSASAAFCVSNIASSSATRAFSASSSAVSSDLIYMCAWQEQWWVDCVQTAAATSDIGRVKLSTATVNIITQNSFLTKLLIDKLLTDWLIIYVALLHYSLELAFTQSFTKCSFQVTYEGLLS